MPDTTARFSLPLLSPGQAQKEVFHNEALAALDLLVAPAIEAAALATPPAAPAIGQAWIVGDGATGDWAGRDGMLSGWTAGGWRFVAPHEGLWLWSRPAQAWIVREAGGWTSGFPVTALTVAGVQVVGPQQPAIADSAGGAVVDGPARAVLTAILAALRTHGLIAP